MASGYSRHESVPFIVRDYNGVDPYFFGKGRIDFDPRMVRVVRLDTMEEMLWNMHQKDSGDEVGFTIHVAADGTKTKVPEDAGGIKSFPPNEVAAQYGKSPRPDKFGPVRIGPHAFLEEGINYVAEVFD